MMAVRRLALTAASVAIALVAVEALLRVAGPLWQGYFVLVPGTDWTILPVPDVVRGVSGVGHYRVNWSGIRGRPFGRDDQEYRILAVGGSTTECAQLDDEETWTTLVERGLGPTRDGRRVWTGGVGRSGLTTREHVLHLKFLLPQYPRIDAVVAMVGINDMLGDLRRGWHDPPPEPAPMAAEKNEELQRAFALIARPQGDSRWYASTAFWQAGRRAALTWNRRRTISLSGTEGLVRARAARARTPRVISELPPLDRAIAHYRRNLHAMADHAAAHQVQLWFVTSPVTWRDAMSDAELADLWMGWIGDDWRSAEAYFTPGALARAVRLFNNALLDVCRERDLACIDAAAEISSDGTNFYDDVHFTEAGARGLAEVIVRQVTARTPFN